MTRIASIGTAARGSPLIELRLDSGRRLRVHSRRILAGDCAPGAPADIDALERWAAADLAEQRLLRLIARRARSRSELADRLAAWEVDERASAELIARLESLGLVDDVALAAETAARSRRRGRGRLQLEGDLARLRIDAEQAGPVTAAARSGDDRAARQVVAAPLRRGAAGCRRDPRSRGVPCQAWIRRGHGGSRPRPRPLVMRNARAGRWLPHARSHSPPRARRVPLAGAIAGIPALDYHSVGALLRHMRYIHLLLQEFSVTFASTASGIDGASRIRPAPVQGGSPGRGVRGTAVTAD